MDQAEWRRKMAERFPDILKDFDSAAMSVSKLIGTTLVNPEAVQNMVDMAKNIQPKTPPKKRRASKKKGVK